MYFNHLTSAGCLLSILLAVSLPLSCLAQNNSFPSSSDTLTTPDAWQAKSGWNIQALQHGVVFSGQHEDRNTPIMLTCKKPPRINEVSGRIGLWMNIHSANSQDRPMVHFLINDSTGKQWIYQSNHDAWSARSIKLDHWEYILCHPLEAREDNHVPGSVASGPKQLPQAPLTWQGVKITGISQGDVSIALAEPDYHNLDLRQSQCYWTLGDRYLSNEQTGSSSPFLLASDLAQKPGNYSVVWQVTVASDGHYVTGGVTDFEIHNSTFASRKRLHFPVTQQGTYRLNTRVLHRDAKQAFNPQLDQDHWLLIFAGGHAPSSSVTGVEQMQLPSHELWLDPAHPDGRYAQGPLENVPVMVRCPDAPSAKRQLHWQWKTADDQPIVLSQKKLTFSGKNHWQEVEIALPKALYGGAMILQVSVLDEAGTLLDQKRQTFGVAGLPMPLNVTGKPIADQGVVQVGVTGMGPKFRNVQRYRRHLAQLKEMGFKSIELHVEWATVEPLPGVWSFDEMDRLIAIAYEMDFAVVLRYRNDFPRYTVPDWVDAAFMCQQDGVCEGIISAGPPWTPFDRRWVDAYLNFFKVVAQRYANHQAIIGHTVLHNEREAYWVDRPFKFQFTDYSELARKAFGQYLRKQYDSDLAKLNKAWQSQLASWDQLAIPQPDWSTGEIDQRIAWQDWMQFKTNTFNEHLQSMSKLFAQTAPAQILRIYTLNGLGGPPSTQTLELLKANHCELALGGTSDRGRGNEVIYPQIWGLPIRVEPNSYGFRDVHDVDEGTGLMLRCASTSKPRVFTYWPSKYEPSQGETDMHYALARWAKWDDALTTVGAVDLMPPQIGIAMSWQTMLKGTRGCYSATLDAQVDREIDAWNEANIDSVAIDDAVLSQQMQDLKMIYVSVAGSKVMSEQLQQKLVDYVRGGGTLLLPLHVDDVIAKELGVQVQYGASTVQAIATQEGQSALFNGKLRRVVTAFKSSAADQVLARFVSDQQPAIVQRQVGKGRLILLTGLPTDEHLWVALAGYANVARYTECSPQVTTQVLRDRKQGFVVYLFNRGKASQVKLRLPVLPYQGDKAWKVQRMLTGESLGNYTSEDLQNQTLNVNVESGRGALLYLTPVIREARQPSTPNLGHTFSKLRAGESVNIAYFGGSITSGARASDLNKTSWRALTTKWFARTYPDAKVHEINAAIGGTGSDLGAFRCSEDVLQYNPDMVFIEFAVNDGSRPAYSASQSVEGIIRQIKTHNPATDIVMIYTVAKASAAAYKQGQLPDKVQAHHEVAQHYGLCEINVGKVLWQSIDQGGETWQTLTYDTVHPNDAGYALYYKTIIQTLEKHRDDLPPSSATLLDPITARPWDQARLIPADQLNHPQWQTDEPTLKRWFDHGIAVEKPTTLTFEFTGSIIGLYWVKAPDAGDITWSVDGSRPRSCSGWDKWSEKSSRRNYVILDEHLKPGQHRLTLHVLGSCQSESRGTWVRLGGILAN